MDLFRTFRTRFVFRTLLGRIYEPGRVTVTKAEDQQSQQQQEPPESAP